MGDDLDAADVVADGAAEAELSDLCIQLLALALRWHQRGPVPQGWARISGSPSSSGVPLTLTIALTTSCGGVERWVLEDAGPVLDQQAIVAYETGLARIGQRASPRPPPSGR